MNRRKRQAWAFEASARERDPGATLRAVLAAHARGAAEAYAKAAERCRDLAAAERKAPNDEANRWCATILESLAAEFAAQPPQARPNEKPPIPYVPEEDTMSLENPPPPAPPDWANSIAREWYARPSNRIPSEILITGLAALLTERFGPVVKALEWYRNEFRFDSSPRGKVAADALARLRSESNSEKEAK